jgi:hypothetical protein
VVRVEWNGEALTQTGVLKHLQAAARDGTVMYLPQSDTYIGGSSKRGNAAGPGRLVTRRADLPATLRDSHVFPWRPARIVRDSVFGEIQRVASNLAADYHWNKRDAVLFLVGDRVPRVDPICLKVETESLSKHDRLTATLEFEPWITDQTVLQAYRGVRRLCLEKQGRLMTKRRLTLFDFVENYRQKTFQADWGQLDRDNVRILWKGAYTQWTQAHANWRYRSISEMRSEFKNTSRELLKPSLTDAWR